MQEQIILVEDDHRLAEAIGRHLRAAGYRVEHAAHGSALRRLLRQPGADLILLDLNLGFEDGLDLATEVVANTSAALIIVTGRAELQDRIDGFEAGADDYIIKPCDPAELLARVRAVLRRRAFSTEPTGVIDVGPYRLDPATRRLSCDGCPDVLPLTQTETRILTILLRQHGRAVSRVVLHPRGETAPDDRSVDVHVGNIRRKLRAAGMDDLVIWPVRGYGYRLRLEAPSAPPPTTA